MENTDFHSSYTPGEILRTYATPQENDLYRFFRIIRPTSDDKGVIAVRIASVTLSEKKDSSGLQFHKRIDPEHEISRAVFLKYGYTGLLIIWDDIRKTYMPLERVASDFSYHFTRPVTSLQSIRVRKT